MADIQSLKESLSVSPNNLPLLLMLGDAYLEELEFDQARQIYESALEVDPGNPVARTQIAQLLELDGRSSEAILRLDQVVGEHPDFAPAWMMRAKLALTENNGREARECYEKAVSIEPALQNEDLLKG